MLLFREIYSFRSFPTAAVETDDDDDEFQFGPGVSSTFGCLDRILRLHLLDSNPLTVVTVCARLYMCSAVL
jgi:hypothetical protein